EVQAHGRTQGDAPTLMPDDAQRATEEPVEINDSIETIDEAEDPATEMIYTSDVLEFPWEQEVTEPYVEAPIDSYFSSEDATTEQNIPEFPEPDAQDVPFPADFAPEKETDTTNATEQTENALLYTERPSTTKVPNRARPRTRKKNTRPSVERR
ncbi:MAG: hypothetical protein H0V70_02890, partial [Ktedonobacteraceae bacterium]|nr:hypothetical protein [Ktedonobacteraceae bacterium]